MRKEWIERGRVIVAAFSTWEEFQYFQSSRRTDYINHPGRAKRCAIAVELGGDGSTRAENIEDMRKFWRDYVNFARYRGNPWREYNRTIDAVDAYLDQVEQWHAAHDSLFQEAA